MARFRPECQGTAAEEPDRAGQWHLSSPQEVADLAQLLKRRDGIVECISRGHSMGQTIPDGTPIRFQCGRSAPVIGDVIVQLSGPSQLLAHRVVGHGKGPHGAAYLITRGDASLICDRPTRRDAVLGIVVERSDGTGWTPIPAPMRWPWAARAAMGLQRSIMQLALACDFRLAVRFAAMSYAVLSMLRGKRR